MYHMNFSPDKPLTNVKLCTNCTHYQTIHKTCALYGRINIIDGTLEHSAAIIVRPNFCQSTYYLEKDGDDVLNFSGPFKDRLGCKTPQSLAGILEDTTPALPGEY